MVGQYREAVQSSLPEIPDHWTFDAIDIFMKDLTTSLISSASSCFPAVQFHKFQRPFWDKSLRAAHSKSKQAYHVWCGLGRPSASNDPSRLAYKRLKCLFRRQLRRFKREEANRFLRSLNLNDQKLFHHMRMRNGGSSSTLTSSICFNNRVFEGAAIVDGWASYFESLATPDPGSFCPRNRISVESKLLGFLNRAATCSHPELRVSSEQVSIAL